MSRCVTLLMQVLKETNDGRMLMQLSMQLGKIPESDKYSLNKKIFYFLHIFSFININLYKYNDLILQNMKNIYF